MERCSYCTYGVPGGEAWQALPTPGRPGWRWFICMQTRVQRRHTHDTRRGQPHNARDTHSTRGVASALDPGAPADADPCDMQPAHTRTTQARTRRTTRGRAHHTAQHKRAANTATRARTRHAHEAEPAHT